MGHVVGVNSLLEEGIPEFARPPCQVTHREFNFWNVVASVSKCLDRHGYHHKAAEFRQRALTIAQVPGEDDDDEHHRQLIELVVDYVEGY